MKKLFLFFAILSFLPGLKAQTAPMFETKIVIVDAIGNVDSIVIGYDLGDILYDTAQFHEILDNSPFDSIFDVRVEIRRAEILYEYPYLGGDSYKRLITSAETATGTPTCTLGGSCVIFIHAKHLPVTIHWDSEAFDPEHCRENAFFTPDKSALISDPPDAWINPDQNIIFGCASRSDSMVCWLSKNISWDGDPNHFQFFPIISIRPIEGIGIDTVVGISLEFPFGSYFSPCRLISSTEMPQFLPQNTFNIFPNPSTGVFNVLNERNVNIQNVQLLDPIGNVVLENNHLGATTEAIRVETNGLVSGIYFVSIQWGDGHIAIRKLVKM